MSGPETSGEFTVLASARREWAGSDKQRILAEAAEPGANVSEVARRNAVAQSLLYRWRKDAAIAAQRRKAFVPVTVSSSAAPETHATPPTLAAELSVVNTIEILLANGRLVRASAGIDTAALARIVSALEAPT